MIRWFVLFLSLLGVVAHAAEEPATVPMQARRIGAHSWYVEGLSGAASSENQGFMSNAGFVVTPAGVVVFDALASPPLARRFLAEIRKQTPLPVKLVIVSHYHADHFYGLQVFKEAGAEIWAHALARGQTGTEAAAARLAQRREVLFPWVDEHTRLLPPDRYLDGDTDLELGGVHLAIRHVGPAHSAEDLALLVREDGVLYGGDLVFKGRVPFVGDADSRAWLAALDRLIALKPRVLVPGHGVVSETPVDDLGLTRDYLEYLRRTMGAAVEAMRDFDAAYAATDWSRYRGLPAFEEANRANAYNQYLQMARELLGR